MGQDTQLPSLELSMDLNSLAGVCNNGYACVYQNCLSWSSPTTPLPSEAHPRLVFERLFGEGGSAAGRRAALRSAGQPARFVQRRHRAPQAAEWGSTDRVRVDQYLDSVREVERQIQRAEAGAADNPVPDLDRPVGVPAAFADHAKLMFDLQVLAFQADITRVVTLPAGARAEQPHVSGNRRRRTRTIPPVITATIRKSSRRLPRSTRSTCRCSRSFSRS